MIGTKDPRNPWAEEASKWLEDNGRDAAWVTKQAGLGTGTMSKYLNRNSDLGVEVAAKIAPLFGMSEVEFFKWCGLIEDKIKPETVEDIGLINSYGDLTSEQQASIKLMMKAYREENAKKERGVTEGRKAGVRTRVAKAH